MDILHRKRGKLKTKISGREAMYKSATGHLDHHLEVRFQNRNKS